MSYQLTCDCADPDTMARFWAEALGFTLQEPPFGFDSWRAYWLSVGVPEDEVEDGYDSIVDTKGAGMRVWFQKVPEPKTVKNRMHFDLLVGGGRTVPIEERRARVRSEAQRLTALGAEVIAEGDSPDIDHFFISMHDPEGNEFDIV